MKHWLVLAAALFVTVALGCSRAPVASVPQNVDSDKELKPRENAKPKPPDKSTPSEQEPELLPLANPTIVKNKEAGILRGMVRWEGEIPARSTPRLRIDPDTRGVADALIELLSAGKTQTTHNLIRVPGERDHQLSSKTAKDSDRDMGEQAELFGQKANQSEAGSTPRGRDLLKDYGTASSPSALNSPSGSR